MTAAMPLHRPSPSQDRQSGLHPAATATVPLGAASCSLLPRRRPGFGGAWLQSRDDIDHDRSVGGDRLLEGRGDLVRLLDTDATHAEAAGDRAKIGRPEANQCLAAVQTI